MAERCSAGIETTAIQLDRTGEQGGIAKGERAKATSLIASARIDRAFDEYAGCVEKVGQAQAYLQKSQS